MTFVQRKTTNVDNDFERLTSVNQCFVFMIGQLTMLVQADQATPLKTGGLN